MAKIIVCVKGGLGNQLFCYAAARRLAIVNNAELVIDHITGFARDYLYNRRYLLDQFCLPVRKATPAELLEPFGRYRRYAMKWFSGRKAFEERRYIKQEGVDFDMRLLTVHVKDALYLDGYWQSERYFKDVEEVLRDDMQIIQPRDDLNQRMAEEINNSLAVAIHVRWFDRPGGVSPHNVSVDYYHRAIELMEAKFHSPHYFVFSDFLDAAHDKLFLPKDRATFVVHNRGEENAYADLWLMTQCKHFIIANSTFSWWGAWLAGSKPKHVIAPGMKIQSNTTSWGFEGQVPGDWLLV
jgi:hypothetical protein